MDGRDAGRGRPAVGRVRSREEDPDAGECEKEMPVVGHATNVWPRTQIIGILVRAFFPFTASETILDAELCVRAYDDRCCEGGS